VEKHGSEQTHLWRRSFDVPPPPVANDSPEHPRNDARYRFVESHALPATECLKDVVARVMPYFHTEVVPQLNAGMNVLITAHGNSLRALLMQLENVSEAKIAELNIPTGVPRRYELAINGDKVSMKSVRYLGDQAAIAKAAEAVANQTKG